MTGTVTRFERLTRHVRVEYDLTELRADRRTAPVVQTMHGVRRGGTSRPAVVVSVNIEYSADSGRPPAAFERPSPNGWLVAWRASIRPFLKSGGLGEPVRVERYSMGTAPELLTLVEALIAEHEPPAPSIGDWT